MNKSKKTDCYKSENDTKASKPNWDFEGTAINTATYIELSELEKIKSKVLTEGSQTYHFKNRLHELAFYFSHAADTGLFDKELAISKVHFVDSNKARRLRKVYLGIFSSNAKSEPCDKEGIDCESVKKHISTTFNRITRGKIK